MNKKQKMFGTGKHRKMIVAGTLAGMTLVSGMFSTTYANDIPNDLGDKNQQSKKQSENKPTPQSQKQKVGVKKVFHTQSPEVQQALKEKDYEKFLSLTDSNITQNQFDKIVKKYNFNQIIKQSVEDNDYRSFQLASKGTSLQTLTQEDFEEMVSKHIARKTGL